jgi:hypothetical protein
MGKQFPKHAVRIQWRSFRAEILGVPAILLLAGIVLLVGIRHLPELLSYLPHLPW